jgi:hypothetical protein
LAGGGGALALHAGSPVHSTSVASSNKRVVREVVTLIVWIVRPVLQAHGETRRMSTQRTKSAHGFC